MRNVDRNSYAAVRRSPHINSLTCQMSGITAGVCLIVMLRSKRGSNRADLASPRV